MQTRKKYIEELNELNLNVVQMSSLLENAMEATFTALETMDAEAAEKVMKEDIDINQLELHIELSCIKIIAKQQPVATDLRKIISIARLIGDIERIADHCSDISEYIVKLSKVDHIDVPEKLGDMVAAMKKMVSMTIDSFITEDLKAVKKVVQADDAIDNYFIEIKKELCKKIQENPERTQAYIDYLMIVKYVERMADHATNIVGWVYYIITGDLDRYLHADPEDE